MEHKPPVLGVLVIPVKGLPRDCDHLVYGVLVAHAATVLYERQFYSRFDRRDYGGLVDDWFDVFIEAARLVVVILDKGRVCIVGKEKLIPIKIIVLFSYQTYEI